MGYKITPPNHPWKGQVGRGGVGAGSRAEYVLRKLKVGSSGESKPPRKLYRLSHLSSIISPREVSTCLKMNLIPTEWGPQLTFPGSSGEWYKQYWAFWLSLAKWLFRFLLIKLVFSSGTSDVGFWMSDHSSVAISAKWHSTGIHFVAGGGQQEICVC